MDDDNKKNINQEKNKYMDHNEILKKQDLCRICKADCACRDCKINNRGPWLSAGDYCICNYNEKDVKCKSFK